MVGISFLLCWMQLLRTIKFLWYSTFIVECFVYISCYCELSLVIMFRISHVRLLILQFLLNKNWFTDPDARVYFDLKMDKQEVGRLLIICTARSLLKTVWKESSWLIKDYEMMIAYAYCFRNYIWYRRTDCNSTIPKAIISKPWL